MTLNAEYVRSASCNKLLVLNCSASAANFMVVVVSLVVALCVLLAPLVTAMTLGGLAICVVTAADDAGAVDTGAALCWVSVEFSQLDSNAVTVSDTIAIHRSRGDRRRAD